MPNEPDDEQKMMWYRSAISAGEKSVMLAIMREYVQEHWRDARIVYKTDRKGNFTDAAIGIAKPILDKCGNYAKQQHAVQLLTKWRPWNNPTLHLIEEWELYLEAYGFCKYQQNRCGKNGPEYDALTQHRANQISEV
jgi:hypothetical protein